MYVSLDLETTGVKPENDSIIEFGAVKFDMNGEKETLQFLVNPGIKLPDIITHITKITDEDLKDAPLFSEKEEEVRAFIQDFPIIGHNIKFDTGFLRTHNIEVTNPEYDTHDLASTLLTGLSSYSLEILSKTFDLQHKEKHRALDDAIAAMELFLELTKRFESMDPDLLKKIQGLCSKSNWKLKDYFLGLKSEKKEYKTLKTEEKEKTEKAKSEIIDTILNADSTTLFEVLPPYLDLAKQLANKEDKDSYIAVPHQLFKTACEELEDNIAKIDTKKNYISLKRLAAFEKKEFFEDHEISAILKYLIWSKETKTGLLSEIRLLGDEKQTIHKINADPLIVNVEKELFIKKAIEKDKDNAAICSHQYILDEQLEAKKLIILDFDDFMQSFHYHNVLFLNIEKITDPLTQLQEIHPENQTIQSLLSKCTMIVGLVGIIFEKYNDQNIYGPRSMVNENIIKTAEWEEIQKIFSTLIEMSKELIDIINEETTGYLQNWKISLRNLEKVFKNPKLEENMIWVEKDYNLNPIIRSAPLSHKEIMGKVIEKTGNSVFVGESMDLDDNGKFTKKLSGLDQDLPVKSSLRKNEALEIFITQDTPERENPHNKHIIPKFLHEFLTKEKGNTAIICNSRKQLEFLTLELSKSLKEVKVVSQLTGNIGKICEQFSQDPENSVVLLTPYFWDKFKHHNLIKTLFITKIPFAPPSSTFNTINSNHFDNPFMEFQIPQATFALKKLINRLDKNGEKKEAIILDSRPTKKDYGKAIIQAIEKIGTTTIVNLASLTP